VSPDSRRTLVRSGRFEPVGAPDWHLVPVDIPSGVRRIDVRYSYNRPETPPGMPGNVLDIGIFDPSGAGLGNAKGFRGYSGGARSSFSISRSEATPGYVPGPIDAGRWHLLLGPYTVAPQGMEWRVDVALTLGDPGPAFEPAPAPTSVAGTGPGWYRGDLHLHTVHSDGRRTPARLAADARAAGLGFIVSTEHNTRSAHAVWGRHSSDDLLVIAGEEVTTRSGHWVAAGLPAGAWIDWRYRAGDGELGRFVGRVHELGGIAIAAHPFAAPKGTRWEHGYDEVDAVEAWNGPWGLEDQTAVAEWHARLVAGQRLPIVGSSDAHTPEHVVGLPQTVVRAERLAVGALVDAVRAGRSWIAESSEVELRFEVRDGDRRYSCGDPVPARAGDLSVRLEVSGVPGCVAAVLGPAAPLGFGAADDSGRVVVETRVPAARVPAGPTARVPAAPMPFVRAEVRRPEPTATTPDRMVALTNPIFVAAR
jgi:predicted metal-dependent phosphoesterase TrpH